MALTNSGVLYQWGQECANEALTKFTVPTKVSQIDNVRVTSVACGTHHSVCMANWLGWYGTRESRMRGDGVRMVDWGWVIAKICMSHAVSTHYIPLVRL